MKKLIRLLAGLGLVAALGIFGPARPAHLAAAGDVTLAAGTYDFNTIAAADGGSDATVYEVVGNLTLETGDVIECNDPVSPNNDPACDIEIEVGGNMLMEAGSAIDADNLRASGKGGDITITVGGPAGGSMIMCAQTGSQTGCSP